MRSISRFLGIWFTTAFFAFAADAPPRIAILGDSITYAGGWPTLVESALRGTPRFRNAAIVNFGLPSETVSGLSEKGHAHGKFPRPDLHERLERVLDAYKPTLVIACYGMNDGIYLPLDPVRMKAYQDGCLKLKNAVEKHAADIIFITPPLHQADKASDDPMRYDAVLDSYGEWLVARKTDGWKVIDIRPDLKRAVAAAKQADPKFVYAKDGVHPAKEGHGFIAASVCKQLWPILQLPDSAHFADGAALQTLTRRNELLKLAWLSATHHLRPGIPTGLPLQEAETQAAKMLELYFSPNP